MTGGVRRKNTLVLLLTAVLLLAPLISKVRANEDSNASSQDESLLIDGKLRKSWVSAIGNDQAKQLQALLDLNEAARLFSITADNGKSALMVAAKVGDLALMKYLIEAGAGINDTTQTKGSAFMFAVLGKQEQAARWLLKRGADIHMVGSNGWNAVTIVAAKGYVDLLQWLLAEGADAQVRDVYRYTPLMRAVENNHEDIVSILLALPDTDADVQDEFGNTSLHHAVAANNATMVSLLVDHGVDTTIKNRKGSIAGAQAQDKPEIKTMLRRAEQSLSGRH